MKTWKSLFIIIAVSACKGDQDYETTAASSSNSLLKFDGKSSYQLEFGDLKREDLVLSFIQQDEIRTMDLKELSVGTATELTETSYYPRYVVQVISGDLSCVSGSIPFSDSMPLDCKDSSKTPEGDKPEGQTTGQTPSSGSTLGSCSIGNSPATIDGAKYDLDVTDGELVVQLSEDSALGSSPRLLNRNYKFKDSSGMFQSGVVVAGTKKTGSLGVQSSGEEYIVFFQDTLASVSYKIGTFSKRGSDIVSGTGNQTIYRVNFEAGVCMAKFKVGSGFLSGGAGYLVIGK